jgi:hypothetical protein
MEQVVSGSVQLFINNKIQRRYSLAFNRNKIKSQQAKLKR